MKSDTKIFKFLYNKGKYTLVLNVQMIIFTSTLFNISYNIKKGSSIPRY